MLTSVSRSTMLFLMLFIVYPTQNYGSSDDRSKPNLLFIMTDQQRFDAIGYVQQELKRYEGKTRVRTPNLDRLIKKGAYFRNAYSHSPVCGPARGVLRTGCTIERTGFQANKSEHQPTYKLMKMIEDKVLASKSIDQVLAEEHGYDVEYFGKWHLAEFFHFQSDGVTEAVKYNDYDYETGEFSLVTHEAWKPKLIRYLRYDERQGNIKKEFKNGDQPDTYTLYPYTPVQLDSRYGRPTNTDIDNVEDDRQSQPNVLGIYSLGSEYTPIHYNADVALKALDRLGRSKKHFALTVSFHNPHAPMIASWDYLQYYWNRKNDLFVSPNYDDDVSNSAYDNKKFKEMGYDNPQKVKEWISLYYAMVEHIDVQVGKLLRKLEQYGIADNTLIVFTSDHGEMLGSHAMREKNVFYEESVRVPLIMVFPGHIPEETVVDESAGHIDLYSTILDYLGCSGSDSSDGTSLRRFIEGSSYNQYADEDFVVAEWDFRKPNDAKNFDRSLGSETNFMVVKGEWKLMITKLAKASRIDMLYNLRDDPYEVNNLIGKRGNSASNEAIGKAEHLKILLIEWMAKMTGPGYYGNDPAFTDSVMPPFSDGLNSGDGDIVEVFNRRTWRKLNIWVSDSTLMFGRVVWNGNKFVRNEYLYFGRTTVGILKVDSVEITGPDASYFTIEAPRRYILSGHYARLRVSFTSDVPSVENLNARIELNHSAGMKEVIDIVMGKKRWTTFSPTTISPTKYPTKSPIPTPATPQPMTRPPTESGFLSQLLGALFLRIQP